MANKIKEEEKLYEEIERDKGFISPELWTAVYGRIEDSLMIAGLILEHYIAKGSPLPRDQGKLVMDYMAIIQQAFHNGINPQIIPDEKQRFIRVERETHQLHKNVRLLLGHYIGNDLQAINFMIGDILDSPEREFTLEVETKIWTRVEGLKDFLNTLRSRTLDTGNLSMKIRAKLTLVAALLEKMLGSPTLDKTEEINRAKEELVLAIKLVDGFIQKGAGG
ncbi:MAG: hypothetical protein HQL23_09140 [Candidatus Omnitrophica bacterium]|nr:hypothetical protein [Candidatus Omnitrophota bacterium]